MTTRKRRDIIEEWFSTKPKHVRKVFFETMTRARRTGRNVTIAIAVFREKFGGPPGSITTLREAIQHAEAKLSSDDTDG